MTHSERSVAGLLTRSPTANRVIAATRLAAEAWELTPRFVHVGACEDSDAQILQDQLRAQNLPPESLEILIDPNPSRALLHHVRSTRPVLVVLGAPPSESAVRDLIGSTARRLSLRAECSVLIISTQGRPPTRWQTVVIDVEYSESGGTMAAWAVQIAPHLVRDPRFIFAHQESVHLSQAEHQSPFTWSPQSLGRLPADAYQLANFVDSVHEGAINPEAVILRGRPGADIASFARDVGCDLMVLRAPVRPLGIISRLLSHPVRLALSELPCSVLLCREPAEQTRRDLP